MTINPNKYNDTMPFKAWVQQTLPTIYDDSLSYADLLYKILNQVNYLTENYNLVTQDMIKLYDYVNEYFDNLDVQDEINNKLDEMYQSGELDNLFQKYLDPILNTKPTYYNNVEEMKNDTTLIKNNKCVTLGYYSINDNGGATYVITDTKDENYYQETLTNGLYANLIIKDYATPEMFGAYGDNVHDDSSPFSLALEKNDILICSDKTYKLNNLTLKSNKTLKGTSKNTIINCDTGIKLSGTDITLDNLSIKSESYGLYCCGKNEGGSTQGDNHFTRNNISNIIINANEYGIYFNAVIWGNSFKNIRINFANYAIYNTDTYIGMTTLFENVYISGSKIKNFDLKKCNFIFNNCNFGISIKETHLIQQNSSIEFNSCNFECDKFISGTGVLFNITGKNCKFKNCSFKITCASTINFILTGSAVESVIFENCIYESVDIDNTNQMTKFFSDQINGANYKCIIVKSGCETIPIQIENDNRLPYSKYPYLNYENINNCVNCYATSDLSTDMLKAGELIYSYQEKIYKFFNGTDIANL